ncbi:hypothetical protein [Enterococcus dongliensis]|uniref:hypothetical protein n=1 Tax=Enterococcus dongliensis TaxID=2559925 RepID=UPI002890B852|nr:hypothetical protein [Enterococcus dongliensis]MDT2669508.1 hypothetical protein [Enterococcus dongliensis]
MMPLNAYSKNIVKSKMADFDYIKADKVEGFLLQLDRYENKRLYASYIQRYFEITRKETFTIVNSLMEQDIIDPCFQIKIGERFLPGEYNNLSEIPETIFDEENGYDVTVKYEDNIFVFYKVNV